MDTLMKLVQFIASVTGVLVACMVFVVGVGLGTVLTWPFKRRIDKAIGQDIFDLENELKNVDREVDNLWAIAFPSGSQRVSAKLMEVVTFDKKTEATKKLINARKILKSFADNLRIVAHNLEPKSKYNVYLPPNQDAEFYEPPGLGIDHPTPPPYDRQETDEFGEQAQGNTVSTSDDMVQLYNRAVNDALARERFREYFSPIRIGTVNAVERRQNPTIKAEIRETTDGDFFALRMTGTSEFAVFPRLGLTIEAISFSAGAVGEVFQKTQGHDPKLFYSHYRVKQPAIFRSEGGHWHLQKPGELELGHGE